MNEETLKKATKEELIDMLDNQLDYTEQLQQENQQLKERYLLLENKCIQQKSVIEEVRGYIYTACKWANIDLRNKDELLHVRALFFKELLQILDKVKENK